MKRKIRKRQMKDLRTNRKSKIDVMRVLMHDVLIDEHKNGHIGEQHDAHVEQHVDHPHVLNQGVNHYAHHAHDVFNVSIHVIPHDVNLVIIKGLTLDALIHKLPVVNPVHIIDVIYYLFPVEYHSPLNPTFFLFLILSPPSFFSFPSRSLFIPRLLISDPFDPFSFLSFFSF